MNQFAPKSAARTQIVIDKRSFDRVMLNLHELPRRVGLKVFRIALNAWGGVVKDKASSLAREETGLLRKSLRVKVKIPDASYNVKHHGKPAYVMVGPGRNTGRFMRVNKQGRLKGFGAAQKALVAERKRLAEGKIGKPLERERASVALVKQKFATGVYRNPTRYAHLVEKGHGGPRPARAYPFIEPAARAGEGPGFQKFADKMREGIAAEAAKLPK